MAHSVKPITESAALIFGGTAGIGFASAKALLEAGLPRLVIVGRRADRGGAAVASLQRTSPQAQVTFIGCDATQPEMVVGVVDKAADCMGAIDILVSSAGGDPMPRLLHTIPVDEVMPTLVQISSGIILPARAVLPQMMSHSEHRRGHAALREAQGRPICEPPFWEGGRHGRPWHCDGSRPR